MPDNNSDSIGAIEAVAAERRRQIEVEGYTPKHDDDHEEHVFVRAAAAYALGKPVLHGYGGGFRASYD